MTSRGRGVCALLPLKAQARPQLQKQRSTALCHESTTATTVTFAAITRLLQWLPFIHNGPLRCQSKGLGTAAAAATA
eukprot:NODE_24987_length_603_cov_3.357143.p2 GENE.NODE_24987_length_603_cov_3.357143~~NODE_24987_length_603_cov_3.357143.p2  ORF type:complete len:77 (-),score=11.18 NODE_24987_length_603_cov_3.357143:45-275(-)